MEFNLHEFAYSAYAGGHHVRVRRDQVLSGQMPGDSSATLWISMHQLNKYIFAKQMRRPERVWPLTSCLPDPRLFLHPNFSNFCTITWQDLISILVKVSIMWSKLHSLMGFPLVWTRNIKGPILNSKLFLIKIFMGLANSRWNTSLR